MNRDEYTPKGYRIEVGNTDEAKIFSVFTSMWVIVFIITILCFFFFSNWIQVFLFALIFLLFAIIAYLHELVNIAFREERAATCEEFIRMQEEIENIKEKLSNK